MIWYPAIIPEGEKESFAAGGLHDAEPDISNSPYPLIVYSHYLGGNNLNTLGAGPHLASYGYVVISTNHNDKRDERVELVDRPLDVIFLIDQFAMLGDDPLVGMVDTNNVGVTGYSSGGDTALLVNGTTIDPVSYAEACPDSDSTVGELDMCYYRYTLWDDLVAYRAQFDPLEEGAVWPAVTDERIRAVVPMTPCYGPIYGERGLAGARVPTLIIGLVHDEFCTYERDAVFIYNHLGTEDRYLLTLTRSSHVGVMGSGRDQDKLNHFTTAFFGYYLQGQDDYAEYFTADFVEQIADLAWGPVEPEQ
jgi:predicted dienelactone hydrolase